MMDTKAKVKNEDNDDKSVKEPVEVDVLCGRGGMSNHHPGNEWYRRLIRSNRPLYRKCPKHTKLLVSKAIVQAVEQQGGRFLEKERKTGLWHVVPYKRAVDKTSQGLRERERDEEGKVSGGDKSALPEQFSGKVEASLDDLADVAIAHAQSSGLPRSASDLPKRATPAITTVPAPLTKKARIGEYQQSDNGNAQAAHALQHQQQQSGGALPVGQLMGPPLQQNNSSNNNNNNNNSSNRGTLAGLGNLLAAQENGSVPLPPAMQARNSSMFRLLRQPELLTCGSTWGNAGNQNSADARRLNLQRGPSSQVLTPATGMASQPSLNFFPSSHVQSAANAPGNMEMPGLSQGTSNALMMFSQNMGNNNQNLAANGLPSNAATTRQPNQPANNQPTSTVGAPGVNSKPPALTRLTTQMSDWLETFWPVQGQGGDGSAGQPVPVAAAPSNGAELQQMLMGLQNRAAGQREAASNQHKARMDAISIANIPPPQANQQPAITNVAPPNHGGRPKTSQGNQNAQQGSFQTPSDLAVPEPSDLEKAVSASLLNLASTPSKLMAGLSSFFGGGGGGLTTTAMFPPGAASLARMDTEAAAAIPPMPPSRVAAGKVSKDSLLDDHEETADEARLRNVPTTGGWPSQVHWFFSQFFVPLFFAHMAPKETTSLLDSDEAGLGVEPVVSAKPFFSFGSDSGILKFAKPLLFGALAGLIVLFVWARGSSKTPLGPYQLVETHKGQSFFDSYEFYQGPDSLGSAGYNTYVGADRAWQLGLINHTVENGEDFVYIQSAPTEEGPRESIRLEGKRRFDRGLFILDLAHMPTGCGVWPAFWTTDEDAWPDNGEIDIVEGVNFQSMAKTALHTSESCSMFAHVPDYARTGVWDTATGLPDTFTGEQDNYTRVKADNCWNLAPHQWGNQGCVAVSTDNSTLGGPMNAKGGGIYALEWDPANGYIKSWVFHSESIPSNLAESMHSLSSDESDVVPDPESWGLPYGYFAIGDGSGCSSDHIKNQRVIFNLAFCGTVSGNRFFGDCPDQAKKFNVDNDPILSCNAWIASQPKALDEAFWKVKGVYVYQREMVDQS